MANRQSNAPEVPHVPPVENPVPPVAENPVAVTPKATRAIVISARVPLPLDQWEAASFMHSLHGTIKGIEQAMRDALSDPDFKLDTQIVNEGGSVPRASGEAVGGKKRGRKSNAEKAAAEALAAEMAAQAKGAPEGAAEGAPEGGEENPTS